MAASGTIGSLLIEMGMDLARLRKDAEDAKRTVQATVRDMESTAKKGLAAIGVTLSGAAFVGMVRGAIDSADALGKLSEKSGIAVESLSGLKLAAELGDVGFEAFSKGLKNFNESLVEAQNGSSKAAKVFKALGVDINAGPEAAFRQFADAVARLEDGELKTATATTILKKAGEDWIPVLNKGSAGIDEAQRKAEALGLAIGPQFAKDAADFNDNMKLIGKGSSALGISIAKDTLPALIEMSNNMVKARESGHGMWGALIEGAKLFYATLGTVVPGYERFSQDMFDRLSDAQALAAQQRGAGGGPVVSGKIKPAGAVNLGAGAGFKSGMTPAQVDALRAALSSSDVEAKRFTAALQGLEKEYFNLTNEGRVQLLIWETTRGSLKDLTEEHKIELLVMADAIDQWTKAIAIQKVFAESWENEARVIVAARNEHVAWTEALRAEREELKFQIALVGVSAREQEKMNAVRGIELQMRRQLATLPRDDNGELLPGAADAMASIIEKAQTQKAVVLGLISERQAAEREWATGAKTFFDQYVDDATNAAKAAQEVFTTAFREMENALVSFVKTGKLDFRQFADAVIEDLIRIEIRKGIAGVGSALGSSGVIGAIGSFLGFGGARAGGGDVSPGQAYLVGENGPEVMVPSSSGTVIPNGGWGGGGDVYIDARGADASILGRLDALANRLGAMHAAIGPTAIAATRRYYANRGVRAP